MHSLGTKMEGYHPILTYIRNTYNYYMLTLTQTPKGVSQECHKITIFGSLKVPFSQQF